MDRFWWNFVCIIYKSKKNSIVRNKKFRKFSRIFFFFLFFRAEKRPKPYFNFGGKIEIMEITRFRWRSVQSNFNKWTLIGLKCLSGLDGYSIPALLDFILLPILNFWIQDQDDNRRYCNNKVTIIWPLWQYVKNKADRFHLPCFWFSGKIEIPRNSDSDINLHFLEAREASWNFPSW